MELWVRLKSALIRSGDRISVVQLSTDPFKCLPKHWTARQLLDLIYVYDRQIQEQLQELHHSADKPFTVAICLSNCVAYIAAAIATIKAGAVFLPVDPRWPELRIKEVLDHANAVLWLWMEPGVPGGHGLVLPASVIANNQCRPVQLASPDTVLCNHARLDDNKLTYASINDISGTLVHMPVNSGSVYLMYTSGSTGKPVGVYGLARGIINRCDWMAETFPWNVDSDLVCFKTAPCFVDSVWEMFGPLLGGVRLLAAPLATSTDPFLLSKALHDHGVTHITCIPTFWTLLLGALETRETEGHGELRLRQAVCSGEMLGGALLRHLQKVLPQGCRILNIYGSTETAADAAWFDCSAVAGPLDTNASVPVGFPLPGFVIACIQSSDSFSSSVACRLLPFGEEGEVVVGSLCELVAPSYHSNQLATSSSFIDVPLTEFSELNSLVDWSSVPFSSWKEYKTRKNNCPSLRMVCMGDLGHIQNGILILLGRQGNRVKISGRMIGSFLHVRGTKVPALKWRFIVVEVAINVQVHVSIWKRLGLPFLPILEFLGQQSKLGDGLIMLLLNVFL